MTAPERMIIGALLMSVALSACVAGDGDDSLSTTADGASAATVAPPLSPDSPALTLTPGYPASQPEQVDTRDIRMPFALEESVVVNPGWTATPQELDGVLIAPAERGGLLEFTAVTSTGTSLWTAQRPISSAGFAVASTSQGQALAVLTDTTQEPITATAYDLRTGEVVWGPVDVPGPLVGPGLTFRANTEASAVALDPTSGTVAIGSELNELRVLGEFDGAVLVESEGYLELHDAREDTIVWRTSNPLWQHTVKAVTDGPQREGAVLLDMGNGSRTLMNLGNGEVIAEGIDDAVVDSTTSTIITAHAKGLRAMAFDGEPAWATPTAGSPIVHSAFGALVYTQQGSTMRVHNSVTGALALGYQSDGDSIAVPLMFLLGGGAVISVDGQLLLATQN